MNLGQGKYNPFESATLAGCGEPTQVLPPNDVRVCGGRLLDAVADGTGQSTLAMYPKQPFDIAGRTGTVVFDVSADSAGTHAAWPEFWWSDQPVPAVHGALSAQTPFGRNSFGFSIANPCDDGGVGIDKMMVTRNYVLEELKFSSTACITRGSVSGGLNHFEVRISQDHIEVWASDAGASDVHQIAVADDVNLTMTRGLVWLEDVHYNACKDGAGNQCNHTLAWDNLGFDGPAPYRDLSFDVQDALIQDQAAMELGYSAGPTPLMLTVSGVYQRQPPTAALVTFNWFPYDPIVPSVRVNGGPWHDTEWLFEPNAFSWRTIGVSIPVSETRSGTNTIEIKASSEVAIANVNLVLIAGAPAAVPT